MGGSSPQGAAAQHRGTGQVRRSGGPGSTAQFPGLSSHRPCYLFRESDCIRFPDKVASSFAEKQEGRESQDETTRPYTQPCTPQNQQNVGPEGLRQQSVQLAQLADEEETQGEGPA